jgi:hypothetical protein
MCASIRTITSATFAGSPDRALDEARDWQDTQANAIATAASHAIVVFMVEHLCIAEAGCYRTALKPSMISAGFGGTARAPIVRRRV